MVPMHDTAIRIKAMLKNIVKLAVTSLIMTKHGVGDKVRKLDQPRSPGVDENRHLCQISNHTPLVADSAKVP